MASMAVGILVLTTEPPNTHIIFQQNNKEGTFVCLHLWWAKTLQG